MLLTILGGLFVFSIGLMKNATANYTWFCEAVEYAAHASNADIPMEENKVDIRTIRLNQTKAKKYFEHAMKEFEIDYYLKSFQAINTGQAVPRGARAMAPGYLAAIEVKVLDAHVPLVGQQEVWIPMRYFAVVMSERI